MKMQYFGLLFSLVLVLGSSSLQAQYATKIDSLNRVIKNTTQDTNRVRIYGHLSWYHARIPGETDLARKYADSAMALSKTLGYEKGVAFAHLRYGNIGRMEGNYEDAVRHLESAIKSYTHLGDSSRLADGLYDLAIVNRILGNYEKSLSNFYRILTISEWEGNKTSIASTLHSIGIIYRNLKQYDKAIENYNKALGILEDLGDKKRMATSFNSLGGVYAEKGKYDLAGKYFQQALNISQELGNQREIAYHLSNLGDMFNELQNHELALKNHLEALKIREQLPQKREIASSLASVGYTYLKKSNFTTAADYLMKSLRMATEMGSKTLIRDVYGMLSELYAAKIDFQKAYEFHKKFVAVKDSILNEESTKQINELQTKYETAKKDQQITLLATEKELQEKETQRQATLKKAFIGGAILITLLAAMVVYALRQRLKNQKTLASKNEEIKEANFKRQLSELEMKALQAQINPHFIFNCLNSINQMILDGDTGPASRYLTKFSKLIRLVLENAETSEVSLKNELTLLESYIQLEALRFDGEIQYRINIEENIDTENIYLPSMVLQPFVENAIWHGLKHKAEPGKGMITIAIEQEKDQLLCSIEDNGVGREKALELQQKSVWKSKSLGLKITEERLRLFSKELQKQLINITDLKDALGHTLGTRVLVSIPTN